MASAPIDIAVNVKGLAAIQKLERQMDAVAKDATNVTASTAKLEKQFTKTGREIKTAANGLKYFTDAAGRARKVNGQFVTTAEAAAAGIDKVGRAAKRADSKVSGLTRTLRGFVTAAALLGTAKFVIGKTAQLETQTRSLQVLTGELETAKQIVRELQSFAAVTPFTSSELIESAKRLKAFGVDTEKLVDTTQRLADVSGATGARLNEVATAYGQIQAKGRLQGEELLQLQERGIALQDELQKMYGLTGEEFQDAMRKGQISSEAVEVAIVRLTEKGGKYADGAISQSDTLAGKFSTLIDGIENIARTIGTVLAPALKGVLDLAIDVVNNINAAFAAASITDQQKQGFKALAEAEVQRFAGPLPGGPFGAGEVVVRTNGKTYTGSASAVVSQITNDLINKEVKRLTEDAAPKIAKSNVEIKIPDLKTGNGDGNGSGSSKVTDELTKQRAELERQFAAGEDIKRNLENQMMLLSATTDLERERVQIAIDLDNTIRRIQQTAAPSQQEGLIVSATEEARLRDMMAMVESFAQDVGTWDFLPKANEELTETQELLKGAGDIITNNLNSGIKGLIEGTKDWGDILSDVLSQLGSMLLRAGIGGFGTPGQAGSGSGLLGAIFNGKADGGPVRGNQPYLVGERGPELMVPNSSGTVLTNSQTRDVMDRWNGGNGGSPNGRSSGPINVSYNGPTLKFNGDDYIPRSEAAALIKAGAEGGERRVYAGLRNSRSRRSTLGL